MRPDDAHHPDDRSPDDQNIKGGERKVTQAKLERCEGDIGDEVDDERQEFSSDKGFGAFVNLGKGQHTNQRFTGVNYLS
jgi:hypothetical protein